MAELLLQVICELCHPPVVVVVPTLGLVSSMSFIAMLALQLDMQHQHVLRRRVTTLFVTEFDRREM
jgi:hypothetical protein